jgi:hypothetical protein
MELAEDQGSCPGSSFIEDVKDFVYDLSSNNDAGEGDTNGAEKTRP